MRNDEIHETIITVRGLIEEIKHIAYLDNTEYTQDLQILDNIAYNLEIYLYSNEHNRSYLKSIIYRDWNRFLASILKL